METFYQIAVIILIVSNILLWICLFGLEKMVKVSLEKIIEVFKEMGVNE